MTEDNRVKLTKVLSLHLGEGLSKMIFSNPKEADGIKKLTVRPVNLKGNLCFQMEEFTKTQAFQKNLTKEDAISYLLDALDTKFRNAEGESDAGSFYVLTSKKGAMTIKEKKAVTKATVAPKIALQNNRTKKYLLPEGTPVPFLVELGVMTKEGKIINSRYDKFRQINRFLEFVEDILPKLSKDRTNTIIDFGCGKSYLTFAMYYYLKEVKGYSIEIIGLDLKKDVITLCNRLAEQFGFAHLHFEHGDIASFEGVKEVDMVVTLHACDTATDYAMAKAVRWGAKVILSVPCCQHEVNKQIENELLSPILGYGLLKERMSALMTDGIRAELLEAVGYKTQVLEFIDMEHTPKNIMVRAIFNGRKKDTKMLVKFLTEFQLSPTLYKLLKEEKRI